MFNFIKTLLLDWFNDDIVAGANNICSFCGTQLSLADISFLDFGMFAPDESRFLYLKL